MDIDEALICADDEWESTSVERTLAAEVRRLREENERLRKDAGRIEWQPIETAPKGVAIFDIWSQCFGRVAECSFGVSTYGKESGIIYQSGYDYDGPVFSVIKDATHWLPLPPEPAP